MVRRPPNDSIERITAELDLQTGGWVCNEVAGSPDGVWLPVRRQFSFAMCRKAALFGEVPVDQFWFEFSSLYGQRNVAALNQEPVVECFWTLCWREKTVFEDAVQDSYILAKLLPFARNHGSRRVFEDAVLTRAKRLGQGKYNLIEKLEERLSPFRARETDLVDFRDQTAKVLGPPDYPEETWVRYQQIEQQLLGEGRQALERSGTPGLQIPLDQWRRWMQTIGRRRGNELDKQVLDILSYECRAALHRCYSAVWCELLPQLVEKYGFSHESVLFHRLWHLDQCMPSNDSRARFHLFHGHVFALHPGTGIFVQTRTGAELIGEALREASVGPAFRRLLTGLLIAMDDYADRGETIDEARSWESRFAPDFDAESAHAAQIGRTNRRRGRIDHDD